MYSMITPSKNMIRYTDSGSYLERGFIPRDISCLNSYSSFCVVCLASYLGNPRYTFVSRGQGFTEEFLPIWTRRFNWNESFRSGGKVFSDVCSKVLFSSRSLEERFSSFDGSGSIQRENSDWSLEEPELCSLSVRESCNTVKENLREDVITPFKTESEFLLAHYIPVYVMLPLDVVSRDNALFDLNLLNANLSALRAAHVDGTMVDVWWGIVEAAGPKQYNWSAYRALFSLIQDHGLKVQVVMSFHQCGGNVGDNCYIPLPKWIIEIGESNPDIYFTNKDGKRNKEYLSFGIDNRPVLDERTALEAYSDFMKSFRDNMRDFLDSGIITEIEVGLGPAGELRYPSYPESHGWRFPGIGEFQCYDYFLLSDLKAAAGSIGKKDWGYSGPHDAGQYNDWPQSTGFFSNHGSFTTDYGRFFLEWYSNVLLTHGDKVLEVAANIFVGFKVKLAAKIAGVHWWYKSRHHAAELAAGYYNLRERDGYKPIAKMLARHDAVLNFTCIEMRDDEQHFDARCGPESLVQQVLNAGWNENVQVSCENALPRYDRAAFAQILRNARPDGISKVYPPGRRILSFTFLRLCQELMQENNWAEFNKFVRDMHAGLDYHSEPEEYFHLRTVLKPSKPLKALQGEVVPVASVPLDPDHVPFAPRRHSEPFFSKDAPGGGLGAQLEDTDAAGTSELSTIFEKSPRERKSIRGSNNIAMEASSSDFHSIWKQFPGFLL